jgi:hypothetical protein
MTTSSNKELKLTKPGTIGASQLNSSVRRTRQRMSRRLARLAPRQSMLQGPFPLVMGLCIVAVLFLGYKLLKSSGPSVARTEVVTVLSTEAGRRGRWQGAYVHRVRHPNGAEGYLTFDALYRPGAQVKVHYSRNLGWGVNTVHMHAPCDANCVAAEADRPVQGSRDAQR